MRYLPQRMLWATVQDEPVSELLVAGFAFLVTVHHGNYDDEGMRVTGSKVRPGRPSDESSWQILSTHSLVNVLSDDTKTIQLNRS